jgi:hypothetical protein
MCEVLTAIKLGFTHLNGFDEASFLLQQAQGSVFHQLLGVSAGCAGDF